MDFHLDREPWIQVLTKKGREIRSLMTVFDTDVVEVSSGYELDDVAITRLLLGITAAAAASKQEASTWVAEHHGQWNLFDETAPFWQNAAMAQLADNPKASRPLAAHSYQFAGALPTSKNQWHNESPDITWDPAAVARLIVTRQQFSTSGSQPFSVAPFLQGNTNSARISVATNRGFVWFDTGCLAESLALTAAAVPKNAKLGTFHFTFPEGKAPGFIPSPSDKLWPTGILDAHTWQSRSLWVPPSANPDRMMGCTGIRWPQGDDKFDGGVQLYTAGDKSATPGPKMVAAPDDQIFNPFSLFGLAKDGVSFRNVGVSVNPSNPHWNKPAWRHLADAIAAAGTKGPGVLPHAPAGAQIRYGVVSSDKSRIDGPFSVRFPVPIDLDSFTKIVAAVNDAYTRLSSFGGSLKKSRDTVAPPGMVNQWDREGKDAGRIRHADHVDFAAERVVRRVALSGDDALDQALEELRAAVIADNKAAAAQFRQISLTGTASIIANRGFEASPETTAKGAAAAKAAAAAETPKTKKAAKPSPAKI